jgi:phosphate transport system substrate-binding protein
MQVWMDEFQKTHPYVKFKMNVNGSGQGLKDILAGSVDLAMISEEISKGNDSLLWIAPVARLGVVPVVSAKNPYLKEIIEKGITRDNLVDLFSGKKSKTWGELAGKSGKDLVKVYIRGDSSGATATLARYLWIERNEIKGTPVTGEKELINQVKNDPLSLSYCNFIYAFNPGKKEFLDDLKVVPINFSGKEKLEGNSKIFDTYDHLQRAMWLGRYPCSLIRNLYLVSKGKPRTREMVDFMYWIVTDGQRFVPENGYIELYSGEVQYLVNAMKALIQ